MEQPLEEDRLETLAAAGKPAVQESESIPTHQPSDVGTRSSAFSTQTLPESSQPIAKSQCDGATASSIGTSPRLSSKIPNSAEVNDSFAQTKDSLDKRRKSSVGSSEAVRRGLTFGPLMKHRSKHNPTRGILKANSKSLTSRIREKDVSAIDRGREGLRKDYFPKQTTGGEWSNQSSDEDQRPWSSGDEGSRDRGRKRVVGERGASSPSPTVVVTPPEEERTSSKRFVVKPNTNYDRAGSRATSPTSADSEELREIRRAQNLTINSSAVDTSVPHRAIQTLVRGNFGRLQQEAKEGQSRMRTYLVASDLSPQAIFALEWTIGTVLRDGDTLIVVYAVNEDSGTGVPEDCLPIGEGGKEMQETAAVVDTLTAASQKPTFISGLSNLLPGARKGSAATSTDSRALSKAQQERLHALQKLSETCLQYLRKTTLQVRVAIEVISCRVPKSMLTEAIDALKPTLVIVGSRGRSSLKGVLLGSFSNYMVLKSSSPVMVARKRLEGRKSKSATITPKVRLTNNLIPSRRLAEARID